MLGKTVSGGDDPTGTPTVVEPESPPITVTVSAPGTPLPGVTQTVTKTASASPSVLERTVTATPSPSATPQTTPSPTVKPKVVYRTKTAEPPNVANSIPTAMPEARSTDRTEGEIQFPSVAASPSQSQQGITIHLPSSQPVSADSPGAMTWVLVGLLVVVVLAVMSVGLWAFVRKVKREG